MAKKQTVMKKTEIAASNGVTMIIGTDDMGNVKSAVARDPKKDGEIKLKICTICEKDGEFSLNGSPVVYMSPGAVIVTRTNPTCYYKRLPDGSIIKVCYP